MIIIDENLPESQRQLLSGWGIDILQIGADIGHKGLQDDEIIPLLLKYKNPVFFTLDRDFFNRKLVHARYCLVFLDVSQYEAATFIRRFLRYKEFNSQRKRIGKVIKMTHAGLLVWTINTENPLKIFW